MYERFMQLLQANNITPYRVSKETGVTQTTLSDWKTGRATPKTATLQKIADYFNVSLDWLTGENIEFGINPREFEDAAEIKCPICGYNYVHFLKTVGVNFNNIKSNGVAIKFQCEADENHIFYYVFETYKGNTYAIQTDGSTVVANPINEPIYEDAPIPLSQFWNEDKYKILDEHGKDMVNTVLDKEYQRCTKKNIKISDYTRSIAAGTGEEGFTEDKIEEVNDFARQIAEIERNKPE